MRVFVQDPQIQLNELGIALKDAIDGTRDAVLDAEHRSYVNWEMYFFADLESKKRFDADPLRWCGTLTDPVTRQRFAPGSRSPRLQHDGRPYFFYTEANKSMFEANPSMYAKANADTIKM